jgi:hypothetical protein
MKPAKPERAAAQWILSKTGRGMLEILGRTNTLPTELRPLLERIDGRKTLDALCAELAQSLPGKIDYYRAGYQRLVQQAYARTIAVTAHPAVGVPGAVSTPGGAAPSTAKKSSEGEDLDFTAH